MMLIVGALAGVGVCWGMAGEVDGSASPRRTAQDSAQVTGSDSVSSGQTADTGVDTPQPEYVLRPWHSIRGHQHNKIIHIPIGLGIAAFLLSMLAWWRPEVRPAIKWLALAAALGALAAILTGLNQADVLAGSSKDWVISLHRLLGISTAAALWLWTGALWWRPMNRWAFTIGVVALLLIAVTGFFGGVIAHG